MAESRKVMDVSNDEPEQVALNPLRKPTVFYGKAYLYYLHDVARRAEH